MIRVLLAKDLRRAWRNPLPMLINLIVPLCITALIGLAFGGKSDGGALGRIRFAIVDEDNTILSEFLRGAANQREGGKYLDPVILERTEALRQISDNKVSAVLVLPAHFTRNYLTGRETVTLELIKNPAQSIHPAVLEELLGALVTALNAISRNLQSEFPDWQKVIEGNGDYKQVAELIVRAGDRLTVMREFLDPPRIIYENISSSEPTNTNTSPSRREMDKGNSSKSSNRSSGVFAFLLIGMTAMFLLFLANNAMTDLHRELRLHTLARYHTLHERLAPFLAGKILFVVVILLISSVILLVLGGTGFGVTWRHPVELALMAFAYSCFAAGLMAVMVAVTPDERWAGSLNTIVSMALALAGGCAFPPQGLPAFLRDHVTPFLPSYWFADTARNLQYSDGEAAWILALAKLLATGAVLLALAAFLFRRYFRTGSRS